MHSITRRLIAVFALLGAVGSAVPVGAANATSDNEGKSQQVLKARLEAAFGLQVQGMGETKIPGVIEVLTDNKGIVYTNAAGDYVLVNAMLLETKTRQNLTAERMDQLSAHDIDAFHLEDAVKLVHGKGRRKLVTFEDPNCPYCKQLARELEKIDDVTVYTFIVAILGADSATRAKAIWCAPDRATAWKSQMTNAIVPAGRAECDTPFERNLALMKKLHVRGTPALYFNSGFHSPGAMSAELIEKQLAVPRKQDVRP